MNAKITSAQVVALQRFSLRQESELAARYGSDDSRRATDLLQVLQRAGAEVFVDERGNGILDALDALHAFGYRPPDDDDSQPVALTDVELESNYESAELESIREALAAMPSREGLRALALRAAHGLTWPELADDANLSIRTIRARTRKCADALISSILTGKLVGCGKHERALPRAIFGLYSESNERECGEVATLIEHIECCALCASPYTELVRACNLIAAVLPPRLRADHAQGFDASIPPPVVVVGETAVVSIDDHLADPIAEPIATCTHTPADDEVTAAGGAVSTLEPFDLARPDDCVPADLSVGAANDPDALASEDSEIRLAGLAPAGVNSVSDTGDAIERDDRHDSRSAPSPSAHLDLRQIAAAAAALVADADAADTLRVDRAPSRDERPAFNAPDVADASAPATDDLVGSDSPAEAAQYGPDQHHTWPMSLRELAEPRTRPPVTVDVPILAMLPVPDYDLIDAADNQPPTPFDRERRNIKAALALAAVLFFALVVVAADLFHAQPDSPSATVATAPAPPAKAVRTTAKQHHAKKKRATSPARSQAPAYQPPAPAPAPRAVPIRQPAGDHASEFLPDGGQN